MRRRRYVKTGMLVRGILVVVDALATCGLALVDQILWLLVVAAAAEDLLFVVGGCRAGQQTQYDCQHLKH
jgi:hypothetical protein